MRKILLKLLLVLVIAVGGWAVLNRHEIRNPKDFFRLASSQLNAFGRTQGSLAPWRQRELNVIRVASFKISSFNATRASDPLVGHLLPRIISEFDVVAIQDICSDDQTFLKRFVRTLNSNGQQYQYIVGNPSGLGDDRKQAAFIYNSKTILVDDDQYYTINDPDNLFSHDPLVAWFRTRHDSRQDAFTFSVVNLQLDRFSPVVELQQIDQLFRAVRNDGRGEDDVILAGDFQVGDSQLAELADRQGLVWAVSSTPTDTGSSRQLDNILFDPMSTSEFTGESGVFDFMKHFNLTLNQALQISERMPVWAEFEVVETGLQEQVAGARQRDKVSR